MARFVKFEANGVTHHINPDMVTRVSTPPGHAKPEWHKADIHFWGNSPPLALADDPGKIISKLTAA